MICEISKADIKTDVIPALFDMLLTPNYSDVYPDPEYVEGMLELMADHPYSIMLSDKDEDGNVRGVVVGMCSPVFYTKSLRAIQELLFVYPEYRGSTVPRRLIRAFENAALSMGADSIIIGTSSGEDTEAFCRMAIRAGYTAFSRTFKKEF